jgi:hypothetical protein
MESRRGNQELMQAHYGFNFSSDFNGIVSEDLAFRRRHQNKVPCVENPF